MKTKISPNNLKEIAKHNSYLNMRQIEEWRLQSEEIKRLGIDSSGSNDCFSAREDTAPHGRQHVSLIYFSFPD